MGHASGAPLVLTDVAARAGLGTISGHGGAWYGTGVAFVDLDGDGWADLYFGMASGQTDQLCLNRRDGSFACADAPGAPVNNGDVMAIAAGDYDGDGDLDLYVMRQGPNTLLRNDGGGRFTDVTDATGTAGDPSRANHTTGTFLDFDGDGRLDLYLGHWSPMGKLSPVSNPILLRQSEAGTFTDVTASSGIDTHGRPSLAMIAFDYDGDGKQDLFVTGDFNPVALFHNDGGRFSDVTAMQPAGFAIAVTEGMGIDAADLDGDGLPDLYATGNKHVATDGTLVAGETGSALLLNRGDGTFRSAAMELGVNADYSWGTGLQDFDDDGFIDIFVATDMSDHNSVYRNLNGSAFVEEAIPGIEQGHNNCVSAAFADYDNDGRVDVVLHQLDGQPPRLLHNGSAAGHWLGVVARSGRGDLGARVEVTVDGRVLSREVLSQTSHGAASDRRLVFGLGAADHAGVRVTFADGRVVDAGEVRADTIVAVDPIGMHPLTPAPAAGCDYAPGAPSPAPAIALLALAGLVLRRRAH